MGRFLRFIQVKIQNRNWTGLSDWSEDDIVSFKDVWVFRVNLKLFP